MKKVIFMMVALIAISATAQERGARKHKKERTEKLAEYNPQELAQLHTKRLTLALDLTPEQQRRIEALEEEKVKTRREKMSERKDSKTNEKPSKEDRLKRKNEILDKRIAEKAKMKEILNDEQYSKWQKMRLRKGKKLKEKRMKRRK